MIAENNTEEWVGLIQKDDKRAEQEFCRAYYDSTLCLIRTMVREPNLAEDLTQEALLTVLLKLRRGKVREAKLLSRYVKQTAKFIVIAWYRRRANQTHTSLEEISVQDESCCAEEIIFDDQRREIVVELLNSMGVERDRDVLAQHYLQEEEKVDICHEKNLTSQHFDRVISRARLRCRELVARQGTNQFAMLMGAP